MSDAACRWRRVGASVRLILALAGIVLAGGCERQPASAKRAPAPVAASALLDFPAALQCDNPEVNQFVRQMVDTCAGGDYEKFRLLWSVREQPFSRQDFERGWKSLKHVQVVALQRMKTREGQPLYSLHARVELDPSMPEPEREVVMLIVQENAQWRLARAPAHHRNKVLGIGDEAGSASQPAGSNGTPPPGGPSGR